MGAHLERLLRKAVVAGDVPGIERLTRKGAVGDRKGRDGRDAIDLLKDIKDPALRVQCRIAMLVVVLEEHFGKRRN